MRIFSTDHKVIGLQYAFTSLAFLLIGFLLILLLRWHLAIQVLPEGERREYAAVIPSLLQEFLDLQGRAIS